MFHPRSTRKISTGKAAMATMLVAGLGSLGLAMPAAADPVADFYKGNEVRMLIGSGAGGGYDTYTRAFTRHYARHIPGNPRIVNQNVPGAGSLVATNELFNNAPRDGTVLGGIFNTMITEPLIGTRQARFNPMEFSWIGSMGKQRGICVTWHTSPNKTLDDVIGKELTTSATGATGNSATFPRIFNHLLGTNFRVILGYSTSGSRLALERGEVDAICGLSYETQMSAQPDWILEKKVNIIAQIALDPHPDLPHVVNAYDRVTDPHQRQVVELLLTNQEIGRPIVAPPAVPDDRLAALRAAFMATMKDPEFLADAKRLNLEIDPIDDKEIMRLISRAYSLPTDVVAEAGRLVGRLQEGEYVECTKFTRDSQWCS